MNIKDHIKGTSTLIFIREGYAWYRTDDTGIEFPIPPEDLKGATFDATMRSMPLMRWIRKQLAHLIEAETAKADPAAEYLAEREGALGKDHTLNI